MGCNNSPFIYCRPVTGHNRCGKRFCPHYIWGENDEIAPVAKFRTSNENELLSMILVMRGRLLLINPNIDTTDTDALLMKYT